MALPNTPYWRKNKEKANERLQKNVAVIRELMSKLEAVVDYYDNMPSEDVDFGHVGDLHYLRGCLHQALGHEDNPDPE